MCRLLLLSHRFETIQSVSIIQMPWNNRLPPILMNQFPDSFCISTVFIHSSDSSSGTSIRKFHNSRSKYSIKSISIRFFYRQEKLVIFFGSIWKWFSNFQFEQFSSTLNFSKLRSDFDIARLSNTEDEFINCRLAKCSIIFNFVLQKNRMEMKNSSWNSTDLAAFLNEFFLSCFLFHTSSVFGRPLILNWKILSVPTSLTSPDQY